MERTQSKFENNVTASFAYVKKDILMLNDSFSEIFERVAHLISNQAMLSEEIASLKAEVERLSPQNKKVTKKIVKKK
jgi:uncharacterized small protein (DUF1192 family)